MEKNAQEDSILMMAHPKNPKFRLALVADGVGGRDNGDIASYIAVALTMDWFKKIPESFFNSENIEVKRKKGSNSSS